MNLHDTPYILAISHIVPIFHSHPGVVFSDASGFTALTEKLAKQSNGTGPGGFMVGFVDMYAFIGLI